MKFQEIRVRIVKIFLDDFHLTESRMRFLDSLNLRVEDTVRISNITSSYEFFSRALNIWNLTIGLSASVNKLCEILKFNHFYLMAEKLEKEFPSEFLDTSTRIDVDEGPVSFEVNGEVRNFTGRSKELKTLEELFHKNEEYVATITGMGGVGKSELAKRFAHHLKEEYNITIIWFNGQNRETLQASVNRLAKKIQSKLEDLNSTNIAEDSFLQSVSTIPSKMKKRKLVIIDNVDEANEGAEFLIKAKIPEKDCFFLITSRNVQVLRLASQIIRLDIFPDQDAQDLVSTSFKGETDKDVRCLCELLENFPLALQQAVAYIKKQKILSSQGKFYKISDYVDSFATMKKELLGYELNLEHDYELTTLITWKVTMDKISKTADIGELAIAILSTIAYFQPDSIHMGLIQLFFKDNAVREIEKAIILIKTYSLVKGGQNLISIHRLLQQVIQLNTSDNDLEVQRLRKITKSILRILEDANREIQRIQPKLILDYDLEDSRKSFDTNPLLSCIRSGIRHILSVWDHNLNHSELITEFKGVPTKIIDIVYPLRTKLRRIDDVTYFTKTCYSLFMNRFGPNARESLELESELAFASGTEMSERKLNKLDEIYKRQTSILGEDNLLNLKLLEKVSYSIICEGCYSSDRIRYGKYLKDFLRLRDKVSGRGHESTFPVRWELIDDLEAMDLELRAKLIELVNAVPFQDKDHFLQNMREYGEVLFNNRKWGKANYILEMWLDFKASKDSADVIYSRWTLSFIQYCLGDSESANKTLTQAVVSWENRKKKPKQFLEMKSMCDRADTCVQEGSYQEAIFLYEKVSQYMSSLNHPYPLYYDWWRYDTDQKRASCLIQLRRWQDAVRILENEVRWQDLVGSNHKLVTERDELLMEGRRLQSEAETMRLGIRRGLYHNNIHELSLITEANDAMRNVYWPKKIKSLQGGVSEDKLQTQFTNEYECPSTSIQMDIAEEPVSFEVNREVRNFIGRSIELRRLEELFLRNEEYVVTITGMGGIGKSELAKRFAHHLRKEHKITVIWFNGQNRETLQASVNRLAKRVQTNTKDLNSNNMQKSFLESFDAMPSKMKKRKLVIIDNVDEANEGAASLIRTEIPERDCFFLITSRNLGVLNFAGQIINLDIFPDEDAHRLVSTSLENETDEDVKRMCHLLQNFPLALQQEVAYIKEQKFISSAGEDYKISNFVESFQTAKRELLGYQLNFDHHYELTTLITWQMTIEKIQINKEVGELAIGILDTIAYFQPDRIHINFLALFFKEGDNVEKAITLIKRYSLIKAERKLISIHRLLQQVIQLNTADNNLEVQRLREITNSIIRILEDAAKETQKVQPKLLIGDKTSEDLDKNPLLSCIRSGIRHFLSVWYHNCKHSELITDFKELPNKIIDVVYPLRRKHSRIDDVTHFTKSCYSLFVNRFGANAIESLALENEVAFASGPKMSDRKLKVLDDIFKRQTSILGDDNLLNLKLLEKISYSIVCEGCYSSDKIRYGKYLKDFLRLREKASGRGHESTFPVRWELIEELEGKDLELMAKLIELVNDVPLQEKDHFLQNMREYGQVLLRNKKWVKANYIFELWLGFKGTEETEEVTSAKWKLSTIQYILCDRESALQTLQQAVVGWEDREMKPKEFVEMRSECERGDGKVREGDLDHALRLYTQVNDYQSSKNYPFPLYSDWWSCETLAKIAVVLMQLGRWVGAVDILLNKVLWQNFVDSDHKLEIERKELLKKAQEGLRLEEEAAEMGTSLLSKRPRLQS